MYDIIIGNVYQRLIWEKHIKFVINDKICEPMHFSYILGTTLNAFKVTPITVHHHGIVCRLCTFKVSPLRSIFSLRMSGPAALSHPRRWSDGCARGRLCSARPVSRVWCRLGAWAVAEWPCPAAVLGRPPGAYGGRSGLWPSTWRTGLFAALRRYAQCAHNMDRRGVLMFHSHDKRNCVE